MKYPGLQDLENTFKYLCSQSYKGVRGVLYIRGKQKGKTAVISILTHGNEINSLAAAWYLLKGKKHVQNHLNGKIIITLNNIEAGKKYFNASNKKEKLSSREKDVDMNRLPKNVLKLKSPHRPYEIRRVQELYSIWKEADAGLDLHGTDLPSCPMIIDIKGEKHILNKLSDAFPVQNRLTGISKVQAGQPVGSFIGGIKRNIPVIEIETGLNEDPQGIRNAVRYTATFLAKMGLLETTIHFKEKISFQNIYKAISSIIFPNTSYHLVKKIEALEIIKKGQIIAEGNAQPIINKYKSYALFPPVELRCKNQKRITEEELFLATKKSKRKRKISIASSLLSNVKCPKPIIDNSARK